MSKDDIKWKSNRTNMISSSRILVLATKTAPIATRAVVASKVAAPRAVTQRHLSSSGVIAIEKLRGVIEEYRRENYVHELPSRCKKDMLAVADKNKDGRIPVEGIEALLRNIGASDRMSRAEIETILSEEGESHAKVIERDHLMELI